MAADPGGATGGETAARSVRSSPERAGHPGRPGSPPKAKGRIEQLWGTFQGRLVTEMWLAGTSTAEEANKVL